MRARNEWWAIELRKVATGMPSTFGPAVEAAFEYIAELESATSIDDFLDDFPPMLRVDEVIDILASDDPLAALREWLAEAEPEPLIIETIEVKDDIL